MASTTQSPGIEIRPWMIYGPPLAIALVWAILANVHMPPIEQPQPVGPYPIPKGEVPFPLGDDGQQLPGEQRPPLEKPRPN